MYTDFWKKVGKKPLFVKKKKQEKRKITGTISLLGSSAHPHSPLLPSQNFKICGDVDNEDKGV